MFKGLRRFVSFFAMLLAVVCMFVWPAGAENRACDGCTAGTFNGSPACLKNGKLHVCEVNFPDENFRNYIRSVMELNGSDTISKNAAAGVAVMYCQNRDIASLRGISYFTQLHVLNCSNNRITSLDLSGLSRLEFLECDNNPLQDYNLKDNVKLWNSPREVIKLGGWQHPVTVEAKQWKNQYPSYLVVDLKEVFGANLAQYAVGAYIHYGTVNEKQVGVRAADKCVMIEEFSETIAVLFHSNQNTPSEENHVSFKIAIQLSCGHCWRPATCAHPQRCYFCNEKGSAELLSHSWEAATCKSPKKCSYCGKTEGEKGEHMWAEMKYCTDVPYCLTCKAKRTPQFESHDLVGPTLFRRQYCQREGCNYRGRRSYCHEYMLPFTIPALIVLISFYPFFACYLFWVHKNRRWKKWSRQDITICWSNMELNGYLVDLHNNWGKSQ